MKPSQRYIRDSNVMMKFRNAYVDLINSTTPAQDEYWTPVLRQKQGVSGQGWSELRSAVSQAAGAAGPVYEGYGGTLTMRNAAYVMSSINPVVNWEMSLRDPTQLPPETVITAIEGAIASARHKADEAADRERGLTGLVAAFIRWPADLREAVGPGMVRRTAAGTVGVLGQIMVTVVGGAITAGVVAGIGALWQLVF